MPSNFYRQAPEQKLVHSITSLSKTQQMTSLNDVLGSTQPLNVKWWAQYKIAQLQAADTPEAACVNFVELANNDFFILKQIAALRAYEVCTHSSKHISYLPDADYQSIAWLKYTLTDINLLKARQRNDLYEIMVHSFEKSKQPLNKSTKVQLTRDALFIAKKIADTEFTEKMQARLYRLAPRLNNKPHSKDLLIIAHDHRRKRNFKAASKYYKKVIQNRNNAFITKLSAYHGLRKLAKLQHNQQQVINATYDISKFIGKKYHYYKKPHHSLVERYHTSLITLAKTYWTYNDFKNAIKTLKKAQKQLKGKYNLAKIMFIRGRIDEEQKKFEAAIWWFQESLKQKSSNKVLTENTLWFLAWNSRRIGQKKSASEIFEKLIAYTADSFKKKRYQFWLAKTYSDIQQKQLSTALYDTLKSTDPFGYYGLLASRETTTPINTHFTSIRTMAHYTRSNDYNLDYMQWLASVGEFKLLSRYGSYAAIKLRRKKDFQLSSWSPLIETLYNSGQYVKSFQLMGKLPKLHRSELIKAHPEFMFPKPYAGNVVAATKKFGLTPAMVYSIMRQESSFNPKARSFADAFGLMQLLPRVAQYTSNRYKVPYKQASDLYKPETNIYLGTAFLKELFNKHDGQFILAVASYNASEKAIMSWLRTRYTGDTLEFIEDIPYKETRSYVRLVMRNYAIYEALDNFPKNTSFPEWTLALAAK